MSGVGNSLIVLSGDFHGQQRAVSISIEAAAGTVTLVTQLAGVGKMAPMTFAEAGAVIAGLRDARRELLECARWRTVDRSVDAVLVESELGAFGVGCEGTDAPFDWFDTRDEARRAFALATGTEWCEGCEKAFPRDELEAAGEDGTLLCEACGEAAAADWATVKLAHVDATDCPWTGTVADLQALNPDHEMVCPTCGKEVGEDTGEDFPPLELGDIAEPPAAATNVCEHGDHAAPEGQRFCSKECRACDAAEQPGPDTCARICERGPAGPIIEESLPVPLTLEEFARRELALLESWAGPAAERAAFLRQERLDADRDDGAHDGGDEEVAGG